MIGREASQIDRHRESGVMAVSSISQGQEFDSAGCELTRGYT
jgi:hypothetical protein